MCTEPRGDEPEYDAWIDDLDFSALDCVEIECEEIVLTDEDWEQLQGDW